MEISTSNFFLLSLLFLLLLPPFHLFIIFSIIDLGEWFDKLSKKNDKVYRFAQRRGWLDKCTAHMKKTRK